MTNRIELSNLKLKTFTEQDSLDYCQLNSINPSDIIKLDLSENKLTDISGIKLFKNLEKLDLFNSKIIDISVIKNLNKLEILDIGNNFLIKDISVIKDLNKLQILGISFLKLDSDQIQYINLLKNLKKLWCCKGFKDMTVLNELNKNIEIIK